MNKTQVLQVVFSLTIGVNFGMWQGSVFAGLFALAVALVWFEKA